MFEYFLSFMKAHIRLQAVMLILMIISSVCSLASPYVLKIIIDDIFPHKTYSYLVNTLCILVLIYIVRIGINILSDIAYTKVSKDIISDIRVDVFSKILKKNLNFFRDNKSGEIVFLLTNDIGNIQNMMSSLLLGFLNNLFTVLSVLFMLFALNVKLTWVSLTIIPLIIICLKAFIPYVRKTFEEIQVEESKIYDYLINCINNVRVILSYGTAGYENLRATKMHERLIKVSIRASLYNAFSKNTTTFFIAIGPVIVLLVGGKMVFQSELTIGSLIAFTQYLNKIYNPVISLSNSYNDFAKARVSMERIYKHINNENSKDTEINKYNPKGSDFTSINKVEFKEVSFLYGEKIILENLNFTFEKGKVYGIIGESGSGKSSIINLLCKLEKPSKGNVLCDEICIEYVNNWTQHIALIERENQLFNDTIENNISYGSQALKPDLLEEVISDAELINVIDEKKDGLKTNISNYTTVISDGQKQRVSIARALLKKPSIIIFDEATSALDIQLEKKIIETLKRKYSNSIIIIVTHRLNLLQDFDAVYNVKNRTIINVRENILNDTELN